jgi:serine/threonine protein kinase
LGEGTFGMVSAVYDRTRKTKLALKKIKLSRKTQGLPPSAIREVALLKSLNHPNIIKYISF